MKLAKFVMSLLAIGGAYLPSSVRGDTGIAPDVDIVGLRVFDDDGFGYFAWVESALQWVHNNRNAFENPITTVNLSFGDAEWNATSVPSWSMIEDELQQLKNDGIFISAAAGNSFLDFNTIGLSYPAASPYVVPVMSVDDNNALSYYSQRHPIAIAAPGRNIVSTTTDYDGNQNGVADDFAFYSGTSMSTAYVSGAAVLVREAMEAVGVTEIDQDLIFDHLIDTSDEFYDSATDEYYHRINLQAALDALTGENENFIGTGQTVAIIDTGFAWDHFALGGGFGAGYRVVGGHDFAENDADPYDDGPAGSQGTLVAGYIAASVLDSVPLIGDFNNNGAVDAADYTAWRDTLTAGITMLPNDPTPGVVDEGDFLYWRDHFGEVLAQQFTGLAGDYNDNGVVDAADYTVWRNVQEAGATELLNDPTPDTVDESDFEYWREHFGESLGSRVGSVSLAKVPEPSSITLAFVAGIVLCAFSRRP